MKNNNYIPQPEDTAGVEIPAELMELAEQMARNVHEVWARSRMAQGWTWGPERDDAARRHPCLVPYDELPESEKEYDRATSQETLRLILKLGFGISRR
ncbi:MAG: Ryanodine receptor Ryr [Muribaculaceae bacterium]|nr:Ryanodine receptor Ryr [Muribaculaceae bacterium]